MRSWMIAGSLGMAVPAFLPWLPPFRALAVACLVAVSLLYSRRFRTVGVFLLGVLYASLLAQWSLVRMLPEALTGQELRVCGHVEGLPAWRKPGWRFRFRVQRTGSSPLRGPLLQLYTYQDLDLAAGDGRCLLVRLRAPRGFANPGTFDYERWLVQQGVSATGYVRAALPRAAPESAWRPVSTLRASLRDTLSEQVTGSAAATGVLQALAIGDRSQLDSAVREVFQRTGTAHLMAISGLHLALVAGFIYWPVKSLIRLLVLGNRLAAPRAAAAASLITGLAYGLLSGWGLPVQRASIMLACALLPTFLGFRMRILDVLLLACFLVLLWDPLAVRDGGFWLSFGAVAVLLYVLSGRMARAGGLSGTARTQVALCLAMVPLLAGLGMPLSSASLPANLLAVPLTGLLVLPLTLFGLVVESILGWGGALLQGAAWLMNAQMAVLDWLATSLPSVTPRNPTGPSILLAVLGLLWMLAPAGIPARWAGLLLCLPLFNAPAPKLGPGEFTIHALDVGQGLAVLVETRDHALLYDAGNGGPGRLDLGRAVVLPYLRAQGKAHLDVALVSHGDDDHAGGMPAVLSAVPVGLVLGGDALAGTGPLVRAACRSGQQWIWNSVRFKVLSPTAGRMARHDNNDSCVLHVIGAGGSLLLPGDIERSAEHDLIRREGGNIQARILLAPHHGSGTSSSPVFVNTVHPEWVIFSAGWKSRFGHPTADVADRYRRRGARLLNTAESGRIRITVRDDRRLEIQRGRLEMPAWWRASALPAEKPKGVIEYLRSRYWQANHYREGS